jgi:serine/threonine protein kinase
MTEESWRRVDELFLAALDLPPAERAAFFDRECGFDLELRQEAESLLAADAADGRGIALIVEDAAASLFEPDAMAGKRLGAYQVVREIGRGGMGVVYLAVRADQAFERRVAVKVVKRGVDTDAVLGRFRHERQILAGLDHPYIARLIDGGTSADGRPYFVMEYVEGRPIGEFCQERGLTVRQRCELFRKVCEPVAYAHRNLVIHRDLKPANILVTAEGSPKLLDFGIARLLSLDPGENTLGQPTRTGSALTPAYASPEQRRGEAVNTATDVYSLGAVLFEILTGQAPPADRDLSVERPIGKPSEVTEDRELAGDLDNIVLKATHPEQERRYQSVDHLSEDIGRYLTGRPVLAREDRFAYRAAKFIRRNRLAVLGACVLLIGLTAGVTMVLWEARQAELQRQRAERRVGQLVDLANRTLFDVHALIERLPGATEARKKIVGATLEYLDQLAKETGNDARVQSALAAAYLRVAAIRGYPDKPNLGDLPGALETYGKSAKILEVLLSRDPRNPILQLIRADVCEGAGQVLSAMGRSTEAAVEVRRGIGIAEAVLAQEPGNMRARKSASQLHQALAETMVNFDPAAAEQQILKRLPVDQRLAAENPQDLDSLALVAETYSLLGRVVNKRSGDSLLYFRKSAELRERILAIRPNDAQVQRDLMMVYIHIADKLGNPLFNRLGDATGALEYYRKSARINEAILAADPANQLSRYDLSQVYLRIGMSLDKDREIPESLKMLDKSAAILESIVAQTPKGVGYRHFLSAAYGFKGERLKRLRQYRPALGFYQRSLQLAAWVVAASPNSRAYRNQVLVAQGGICGLLAILGDRAGSIEVISQMVAGAKELAVSTPSAKESVVTTSNVAKTLAWAGDSYAALAGNASPFGQRTSDLRLALSYYRQSRETWAKLTDAELKPYRQDLKLTQQRIVECQNELASLTRLP